MKVNYLPTELEVEHPIIGRWYSDRRWRFKVIGKSHYPREVLTIQKSIYYGSVPFTWHEPIKNFDNYVLLPLPLYKRAYHATKRIMAAWISRWLRRNTETVHDI